MGPYTRTKTAPKSVLNILPFLLVFGIFSDLNPFQKSRWVGKDMPRCPPPAGARGNTFTESFHYSPGVKFTYCWRQWFTFLKISERQSLSLLASSCCRITAYLIIHIIVTSSVNICRPPLWSSGQSFWLQIQRSWVRFSALPDFLRSRGSGTGVHSASWGELRSYLNEKERLRFTKPRLTAVGIRCANHATPSTRKGWHQLRRQAAVARSV
jgi:hypothetical protein